jgi:hypothetical protein
MISMRRRRHPTLPARAGRNNYLANDDHEEIGRKVVGAVVLEFLTAYLAMIGSLQISGEQMALSAVQALASEAKPHGSGKRNRFIKAGHGGTSLTG